jgi:hypothetical protein
VVIKFFQQNNLSSEARAFENVLGWKGTFAVINEDWQGGAKS